MEKARKKYLKWLKRKTQKEIYEAEFNIAVVTNLVLEFSYQRLKLLKKKLAEWEAKDPKREGKKKIYDALKEFKDNIKMEENGIVGSQGRIKENKEKIRVLRGKDQFIDRYMKSL